MFSSSLFLLVMTVLLRPVKAARATGFRISSHSPAPLRAPSPNIQSSHVLNLSRKTRAYAGSASYLKAIRQNYQVQGVYSFTPLTSEFDGQEFITSIGVGSNTFQVLVDTGSSDTWLAETGFQCLDQYSGVAEPEDYCMLGPTYDISGTFRAISNENFNITYGDGEFLTGTFGLEEVSIGGITVISQQIAVVNSAAWNGDGISSGLLGLAFPSLTSAYAGTDPNVDSGSNKIEYNPIFTNMYEEGNVPPLFSLAIERGSFGGYLALGGLPPVIFDSVFASSPIQILTMQNVAGSGMTGEYSFYAITIGGLVYNGSQSTKFSQGNWPSLLAAPKKPSQMQVIVDSGTTLIYLPTGIANAVNALFNPPAVFDNYKGAYTVACTAAVPSLGIEIGGVTFYINPVDMILAAGDGTCITGVDDAGLLEECHRRLRCWGKSDEACCTGLLRERGLRWQTN
ncbi:MAG: hypothetical protein FRX48_05067 [Lasallia pustulata]|uniref:Peptidase A1 domain-containing protein n=1 Tax=Lasallia pustulata TaxID=136370 RepID=A0A5M8PP46_9LECA|nr:MAG: hypothetical protein FRX48_05067 [Lasallia pustulata]